MFFTVMNTSISPPFGVVFAPFSAFAVHFTPQYAPVIVYSAPLGHFL
jgi:hypothetical protein